MKKTLLFVAIAIFTGNTITACGNSLDTNFAAVPDIQQTQQVTTSSFSSIKKNIETVATATFKDMDKNNDKMITPDEYGVKTPDQATAFYALDDNHDGKVTLKEMVPNFFTKIGMAFRLQRTADSLFNILDRNKDKYLSPDELNSTLISPEFLTEFQKFDVEKQWLFFNKGTNGKLSKSEFENMFGSIALTTLNTPAAPTPAQ